MATFGLNRVAPASPARHRFADGTAVIDLSDEELSRLSALFPDADIVLNSEFEVPHEPDIGAASATSESNWGYEALKIQWFHERNLKGQGVRIVALDSGVDSDHPAFRRGAERAIKGYGAFDKTGNEVALTGDSQWHGTHVASILVGLEEHAKRGIAPLAELFVGRVLDGWRGTVASIKAGLEWSLHEVKPHFLNLSLGWQGQHDEWFESLREIVNAGTVVVASVGNEFTQTEKTRSPGNYPLPNFISVGAVDSNSMVWDSSGGGIITWPEGSRLGGQSKLVPDLMAPGVDIVGCAPGGSYRVESGTSQAAPHITGLLALVMSSGKLSPINSYELLMDCLADQPPAGRDIRTGAGIVDVAKLQSRVASLLK